jgi:hypothetical protein
MTMTEYREQLVFAKNSCNFRYHGSSSSGIKAETIIESLFIQSDQEIRPCRDPLRSPRNTLYPQKVALTHRQTAVTWSV